MPRIAVAATAAAAALTLAVAVPALARGPAASTPSLDGALAAVVAAGAPGALGSVESPSHADGGAAGVADLRSGEAMRPELGFRAGSITKTMVATVVLQLVAEGRLGLDDPVERHLPGLLGFPHGDEVTVRQLLAHTSGIPDYVPLVIPASFDDWTARLRAWRPEELVQRALTQPPAFPPGQGFAYSNTNYIVAGMLVEKLTGSPLEQELRERVFWPADLQDTSFPTADPFVRRPRSLGYSTANGDGTGELVDVTTFNPSVAWAAGAVVSDADDLARFYRALLGGRLLRPDLLAEMERVNGAFGYGLGLIKVTLGCGVFYGHVGEVPGFQTYALSAADGGRQVVIAANAYAAPSEAGNAALSGALGQACQQSPSPGQLRQAGTLARSTS